MQDRKANHHTATTTKERKGKQKKKKTKKQNNNDYNPADWVWTQVTPSQIMHLIYQCSSLLTVNYRW
jgi:hypothetical protein